MNNILTKTFKAEAAVTANSIVKMGTVDGQVVLAAGTTAPILGVSGDAALINARIEIMIAGIAKLKLGTGGITRGAYVTSDAAGLGVAPGTTGGTNYDVAGIAMQSGSAGDIVDLLIGPTRIQG